MTTDRSAGRCIEALQAVPDFRRATYFHSPTLVVKATRRHRRDRRSRHEEFVVTIGRPNWDERRWAAEAKAAKQRFPFGPVIRDWPKRAGQ